MTYVYMLRCRDGSLYTGYAVDVQRRLKQHQDGKGARYTRARLPVFLCYVEQVEGRSEALRREYAIKRLSKVEKERLVNGYAGACADESCCMMEDT